jgi:hypothetical protein
MVPIAIDVGIGETIQAINSILARRESDHATVWNALEHELQAVALTVGDLDRMYFALLGEIEDVFAHRPAPPERVEAVLSQVRTYCTDGRLTDRLAEWHGAIEEAAFSPVLKHRRYRALASTLRSIPEPLKRYIDRLYHLQDGDAAHVSELVLPTSISVISKNNFTDRRWDLRAVLELLRAEAFQLGEGNILDQGLTDPSEACEQAMRNYDRALSLSLAHLIGHARQELAMQPL